MSDDQPAPVDPEPKRTFDQRDQHVDEQTNVAGDYYAADEAHNVAGLPNPYLGLRAFTYADRTLFGGRERTVEEAVRLLTTPGQERSLLFVVGASGSGKSSFVQAGLLPALEQHYANANASIPHAVMRPGKHPLAALAQALEQLNIPCDGPFATASAYATTRQHAPASGPVDHPAKVLVIDQFEELFTQSLPDQREAILSLLEQLPAFAALCLHLIANVRVDYVPNLHARPPLYQQATRGVDLRAMTEDELKDAIQRPMQTATGQPPQAQVKHFEPELLDALARDAHQDPAYLPLLQVTLEELWRGGSLKAAAYHGLGIAIGRRAEDILAHTQDADGRTIPRPQPDQDAIIHIFTDLVDVSLDDDPRRDVRRRRSIAEMTAEHPDRRRLIDELATARLLSTGRETDPDSGQDVETVDIIHESLIANWDRLRQAVADQRTQLQQRRRLKLAIDEWLTHDRIDEYLFPGGVRLEEARELDEGDDIELRNPDAQEFLKRSISAVERIRRRQRNILLGFVIGLLVLAAVTVSFGAIATYQRFVSQDLYEEAQTLMAVALTAEATATQSLATSVAALSTTEAEKARADQSADLAATRAAEAASAQATAQAEALAAERASRRARAEELAAHAQNAIDTRKDDPSLALLLAREAVEATWRQDGYVTVNADHVLRTSVDNAPAYRMTLQTGDSAATGLRSYGSGVFSPDSKTIVTAIGDGTATTWDVETGQRLRQITNLADLTLPVAFSPDGRMMVAIRYLGTASILNSETGEELHTLGDTTGSVISAAYSPDGQNIVTASDDQTARIWNAATGEELRQLKGHSGIVYSAAFSPDGQTIVTASGDQTSHTWDAATGEEIRQLSGHTDSVYSAAYSPDGQTIVTASDDQTVRIWDVATGQELRQLRGHTRSVYSAAYSPDGQRIVTASGDGTARVWDATTGEMLHSLTGHGSSVSSAAFSPDGKFIVTQGPAYTALGGKVYGWTVRLWDAIAGADTRTLAGHTGAVYSAAYAPNGRFIVTAGADGTARIWDVGTGEVIRQLRGHTQSVNSAAFSPDGQAIVTASWDGTARIWDAATGEETRQLSGHDGNVYSAAYTPDGQTIVTAGAGSTARIWDAATWEELRQLRGHTQSVNSAAYSPDGQTIVTASWDGTARIWDVDSGREIRALISSDCLISIGCQVSSAAFSPNGSFVVTAGCDAPNSYGYCMAGSAHTWNAVTGQDMGQFVGDAAWVRSATYSPDGLSIATANGDWIERDYTVHMWDASTLKEQRQFSGHTDVVNSVSFSPDGRTIVTASADGTARIWLASIDDLLAEATRLIQRDPPAFTSEERQRYRIEE